MEKVSKHARGNGYGDTVKTWLRWGCVSLILLGAMGMAAVSPAAEKATSLPAEGQQNAPLTADLVWARSDGHDYEIFISFYQDGKWSPARQITDNTDNDIVPAVIRDRVGRLWVVWSKLEDGARNLYYKTADGRQWSAEKKIETGYTVNLSAGLAVDRHNQIWLVWSSFDGVDDDIFFSLWDVSGWSEPMRVNTDDSTPDIQPVIGIGDDGRPWVRWSGFEDGEYHTFESRWNGSDWTAEKMLAEDAAPSDDAAGNGIQPETMVNTKPAQIHVAPAEDGRPATIPLPEFLSDPWKAGICLDENGKVSSTPLRMLLEQPAGPR